MDIADAFVWLAMIWMWVNDVIPSLALYLMREHWWNSKRIFFGTDTNRDFVLRMCTGYEMSQTVTINIIISPKYRLLKS